MLFKILLFLHIASGFIALITGLIPMISKKGGKIHNTSGKIYFWAMLGVFLTSQPMAFIKSNVFLFTIGIFSFYFVWTGYRFAKQKGWDKLTRIDKMIMQITFVTSLIMLFFAGFFYWQERLNLSMILGIFGLACFGFSLHDLKKFGQESNPKGWMILHLIRMLGAYIATFTAFAATNLYFLPTLAIWLLPGLIGTVGITLTAKYYRKKLGILKSRVRLKSELDS